MDQLQALDRDLAVLPASNGTDPLHRQRVLTSPPHGRRALLIEHHNGAIPATDAALACLIVPVPLQSVEIGQAVA